MALEDWFDDAPVGESDLGDFAVGRWGQHPPPPGVSHLLQVVRPSQHHQDPGTDVALVPATTQMNIIESIY